MIKRGRLTSDIAFTLSLRTASVRISLTIEAVCNSSNFASPLPDEKVNDKIDMDIRGMPMNISIAK